MSITRKRWFVPAVVVALATGVGGVLVYLKRTALPWWEEKRPGNEPPVQPAGGTAPGGASPTPQPVSGDAGGIPIPPLEPGSPRGRWARVEETD